MGTKAVLPPTQRIARVFGWNGFPHALIYKAKFALRFELGGDLPYGPIRFLQAIDRARQVAKEVFSDSRSLTAIVGYYDCERRSSRGATILKTLSKMGFEASFGSAEQVRMNDEGHIAAFGSDLCKYLHAADFQNDQGQLSVLLWTSIAHQRSIEPSIRWLEEIFIVDFDKGIVLHIYDDRGMDVVSIRRESLIPHYNQFSRWLLDYDREQMDQIFGC